jgi:hypothetical protein
MTDRAIFNRQYSDYTAAGQRVWLANGAGVTTSPASTVDYTAGENLIQGQVVYVSGTYALSASAASGVASTVYTPIGITAAAASAAATVSVILDDTAVVSAANITAATQLIPGEYYYLSQYTGELTAFSTASGTVTAASGYAALVSVGQALSASELAVEIQPPVILYD